MAAIFFYQVVPQRIPFYALFRLGFQHRLNNINRVALPWFVFNF